MDVALDILKEDYGISLPNVFDTLAAYALAVPYFVDMNITSHVPLRDIVRELLGVEANHLPPYDPLDAASMPEYIINCARSTMYLLAVYIELRIAFRLKAKNICQALIQDTIHATHEEADEIFSSPALVPRELFRHCFPLHFDQ